SRSPTGGSARELGFNRRHVQRLRVAFLLRNPRCRSGSLKSALRECQEEVSCATPRKVYLAKTRVTASGKAQPLERAHRRLLVSVLFSLKKEPTPIIPLSANP